MRSQLAPPPVTPIEAYLRRRDWQLAVLIVALVAVPGALDMVQGAGSAHLRAGGAAPDAPTARSERTVRGRHVRPPRSC